MEQVLGVIEFILLVFGGLLILTFLVVIHELGHALVAKRNGVKVEEFGIGFPPRAWSRKVKKSFLGDNVVYSLNWLPLGGFVKLKGETDSDKRKGTFGAASLWVKAKIMLAGVAINWVAAAAIFTIIALFGMPKLLPNQFSVPADTQVLTTTESAPVQIDSVAKNSPAEKAGLQPGDQVLKLDGQSITALDDLSKATKARAGRTVTIDIKRGSETKQLTAKLNSDEQAAGASYLGVASTGGLYDREALRSTWSAPIVGVGLTGQLTWETIKGIGTLLGQLGQGIGSRFSGDEAVRQSGDAALNSAGQGVSGPVGIIFNLFPTFEKAGLLPLAMLTAIISLTLAVMNVLPIPALDGGRLYLMLLFRALKKPLTKEREEKIVAYSFYALLLLVLVITVVDIGKLF